MRSDPKHVGHAKEKEKKEAKVHLALSEELKQRAERESHIRPYVFRREQKHRDIQPLERCSLCEEIERSTVRV